MAGLEKLGRYEIVSELGRGEMGSVYRAVDPSLDRVVALKVIRHDPAELETREFRGRFLAEARAAGRLTHPNIVTIYDFGETDDISYIAMELLEGETLRSMLDRQRFSTRRAVRYASQIADGLAAAHAGGVVHRDIKPANVVRLANGLLKITDFGIAYVAASAMTLDGALLGTPKYMSPEQVLSLQVDGRSDIFSLGVLLYEMLTGNLPFGGGSLAQIMHQIAHDKPIHPLRWNAAIPLAVVRILAKSLAKDPAARYASVSDLARDLRIHKVMDVARDAALEEVFLPLEPTALPPPLRVAYPPPRAENAANDAVPASGAFDQTVPLPVTKARSTAEASAAPAALGAASPQAAAAAPVEPQLPQASNPPEPEPAPAKRPPYAPMFASLGVAAVVVVLAILGVRHSAQTAPPPPEVQVTAPAPEPAPALAVPVVAAPVEEPVVNAEVPKPVHTRKAKKESAPVEVAAPEVVAPAPPPPPPAPVVEAPKAPAISPEAKKAAEDKALRAEAQRQHDCLAFNRCD